MRAADVDLVEMADTAVARGNSDVFELDVHVVFGYGTVSMRKDEDCGDEGCARFTF